MELFLGDYSGFTLLSKETEFLSLDFSGRRNFLIRVILLSQHIYLIHVLSLILFPNMASLYGIFKNWHLFVFKITLRKLSIWTPCFMVYLFGVSKRKNLKFLFGRRQLCWDNVSVTHLKKANIWKIDFQDITVPGNLYRQLVSRKFIFYCSLSCPASWRNVQSRIFFCTIFLLFRKVEINLDVFINGSFN